MKSITSLLMALVLVSILIFTNIIISVSKADTQSTPVKTKVNIDSRAEVLTDYIYSYVRLKPAKSRPTKGFIHSIVVEAQRLAHQQDSITTEDILAIIWVESTFNPKANNNGSIGLMQAEKKSHPEKIRGRDLTNMYVNMEVGVKILAQYKGWVGEEGMWGTYLAYNAGIGNYKKGVYVRDYAIKVSSVRQRLLAL